VFPPSSEEKRNRNKADAYEIILLLLEAVKKSKVAKKVLKSVIFM
jgi:hypothetical protein